MSEENTSHKTLTDWLLAYQLQTIKACNITFKIGKTGIQILQVSSERVSEITDFIPSCLLVKQDAIVSDAIHYLKMQPFTWERSTPIII